MRLTSIDSSFHPCDIYRDCTRGTQGRPKDARSVGDIAIQLAVVVVVVTLGINDPEKM